MANLISKAAQQIAKASRNSLSSYVPWAPHEYGQPLPMQLDAVTANVITPLRMRELVLRTPTAAAAMNTILDYVANVDINVRNVDPKKKADDQRVKFLTDMLRRPNMNDTDRRFRTKLFRDLITLGYAAIEIEAGKQTGRPANLWPIDSGKLYIDYDEHGQVLGYDMLDAHGRPIMVGDGTHAWKNSEVIFLSLNPVSNSLYPSSRIQQLFVSAVVEDLMMAFIGGKFTDSNIPFGVMSMGDITPEELEKAINIWNTQARSQHRIMLTGSKGNLQWVPFGYHLKDLEATQLLETVRSQIMGILGVTANELGESQNINKSNGYNLSYTFKKRAIEPLLQEFCETLTMRLVWDQLGWTDLELGFDEIDSRDELLQAQIDDLNFKAGIWSINHIRNQKGLPDEPGGDVAMVFTGSDFIPVSMIQDFAQAQLELIQKSTAAAQTPQDPEKPGLAQVTAPKPGKAPAANAQGTKRPRGAVQTARNAGIRKEDSQ